MIPEETLVQLKNLLQSWGISPDDWYVTGEAAMVLAGYPITFRDQQMDVLVCRDAWPWPRPEEQVSLFPDAGSEAEKQFLAFIEATGITPDFHPLPHVGIEATDRFEHTYVYSPTSGVRVLSPWAGILHRKLIIEFYESTPGFRLDVFDQSKFLRWKKFIEEVRGYADERNDAKAVETCNQVLPIVERAITYFDSKGEHDHLKGSPVHPGKVIGDVSFWHDGADMTGKIVVLQHALPYQFTQLSKALGIVTEAGGLLSHASVIAREYNVPTIIGVKHALKHLPEGSRVELDANTGVVKILL
jgi:phosphohistidine swiveling domain-containing protein